MKIASPDNGREITHSTIPIVPTMDIVVFPHMIVPLFVLDSKIIHGIEKALETHKTVLLLAAKHHHGNQGVIGIEDLHRVGTIASIIRLIKVPEGGIKILIQGISRGYASHIQTQDNFMVADVQEIAYEEHDPEELVPHIRNIKTIAEKIANSSNAFSPDFHIILSKMYNPDKIADFILSHLNLSVEDGQKLLEAETKKDFLAMLYARLNREVEVTEIQEQIKTNARDAMNQSQKEYYLREQLRAIRQELGEEEGVEIDEMRMKLEKCDFNEETYAEVNRQINRLERSAPDSLDAAVTRNHLEWIFALPWNHQTEDNLDIQRAKQVLEEDHYGLKDVKERILDLISIRNLNQQSNAPILCIVGPPGTGKTSLGKSIARSLGREYARISLGGVRDEAEIRGHRRTYVGAIPGRFIQAMRKAKSKNPVIVIDELDKIGADFRGDPSAAMLEVLDPQQNKTFYDNYLGVPFDLSAAMFIATANTLDSISAPLLDRMEIIELSGYTLEEKINIAQHHLVKKAILETGLEEKKITLSSEVLQDLINNYTREAGVRQLERTIKKLCTKAARMMVEQQQMPFFGQENIDQFLGPRKFIEDEIEFNDQIGITNGLARTAYGGEILKIEAVLLPGKGKLILTGQLGEVMKESAQAALSYARAHAKEFGINTNMFETTDIHIHAPAGAIPKDGPSAGITLLTSILSAYTNRPINSHYAMTGELNLRGEVMPIGGIKEKILAAKRNRMAHVILPKKNKLDVIGLEDVMKDIDIIWVTHANEVLAHVLRPARS